MWFMDAIQSLRPDFDRNGKAIRAHHSEQNVAYWVVTESCQLFFLCPPSPPQAEVHSRNWLRDHPSDSQTAQARLQLLESYPRLSTNPVWTTIGVA